MNKVLLMGRLTRDPEIRYANNTSSGAPLAIANYSLAVNRRFKRAGEADADFIRCVAFGNAADFAGKFLKKGTMIAVSGRLQVSSWTDNNGQTRWSTDVVVEEHYFTGSKVETGSGGGGEPFGDNQSVPQGGPYGVFTEITETVDDEDNLPF